MPVNDKIRTVDYNSIRNKVVNVLGVGSGDAGYGQATQSPTVSTSNRVTVNEYFSLRSDIINAYRHIFGETPPLAEPNINNTIRYNVPGITTTEYTDAEYGIDEFNLETIQGSTTPFPQYDLIVDQIVASKFSVHPSQAITTNKGTQSRGTWNGEFWNNRLSCTVAVTFTTSNQARFFFNSGGEIRFESSRSGGVTSQQNTAWSSLLNAAGMQSFGGNTPGTGVSPLTGQNFYRLTNNYQVWYVNAASSPYTTNQYQISARSNVANNSAGTANTVEFLVEWIDGYTDPGDPLPGDTVDGTITLSLSTLEASGVLVPVGAGNFVVESPAVTIGSIVQDPNGTQFTPQGTITGTLTSGSFVDGQESIDIASGKYDNWREYTVVLDLQGSAPGTYNYTVAVSDGEFTDGNNQKFGTVTAFTAVGPTVGFQVRIRPNQTAQLTATLSRPSFQNTTRTLNIGYSASSVPTISSNQTNLNLREFALRTGWDGTSALTVTINSGVIISSNIATAANAALSVDGSFPNGVHLINNGFIVGMGGAGGAGGTAAQREGRPGLGGGLALRVQSGVSLTLTNNGVIGGGGGGGGGSAYNTSFEQAGGGGGGRTGEIRSKGGASESGLDSTVFEGNFDGGGGGGVGGAGGGGAGGNWGQGGFAGSSANNPLDQGGAGGPAGFAIRRSGGITFVATGTILGGTLIEQFAGLG